MSRSPRVLTVLLLVGLTLLGRRSEAQQFNSDNYWTAPHGTETTVLTVGQYYSALVAVVAVIPRCELNAGATLYRNDPSTGTTQHYSTTLYAKYMLYENSAKNGGLGAMAGTGVQPGYLKFGTVTDDFRSYWANVPVTLPLFGGALSWDLLPGVSVNDESGGAKTRAWGFTYSTRLALYKLIPQSAIVGEVFGTAGPAYSKPQYRAGVRWESTYFIVALTYGAALDQSQGAGLELGFMFLSPRFLCPGGCD